MQTKMRIVGAALLSVGTLLALTVPTAHAATSGGLTFYVARGGTADCAAGENHSTPMGTIGAAVNCIGYFFDLPTMANPDTIEIAAGTYHESGLMLLNVNLVGVPGKTIVVGDGAQPVLSSTYSVPWGGGIEASISGLTIEDGLGGISTDGGPFTVRDSLITHNSGSGIDAGGLVTLIDSTVSDNTGSDGGGIGTTEFLPRVGSVTLIHSVVTGNAASFAGGGIDNAVDLSTLVLDHSSVTGNTAPVGGGIDTVGTLTSDHSVVAGNTASQGGGIWTSGATTLTHTVVNRNAAASAGGGIWHAPDPHDYFGIPDVVTVTHSPVVANSPTNCDGVPTAGCSS